MKSSSILVLNGYLNLEGGDLLDTEYIRYHTYVFIIENKMKFA